MNLITDKCPRQFKVSRKYRFVDSDLKNTHSFYDFRPYYTKKGQSKEHQATGDPKTREIWEHATDFIAANFPKIVYFPTFLFQVPSKIYLEDPVEWKSKEERITNAYFVQVLQDVADSLGQDISITRHIVDRVKRKRSDFEAITSFFAAFMGMDEATQIRAVVSKLSGAMTRTIFGAWNQIFDHTVSNKSVRIEWGLDTERGGIPWVQLQIHDGEQPYAVHERSLGFRWFFTFLLFTQFRKSRRSEQGTVFLFDEPASNLHARAQMKLLESFGKTASERQFIIYSTHSHYMVEPMWLEKAYIVENRGLNFEDEEAGSHFEEIETDVILTRYRQFVHKYPDRVSYFQPALDALKFNFGPLMPGRYAVIVEGKYDFHPLRYFQERLKIGRDVLFIPAPSASEAGTLISLLRGMGTKFLVVLDDDGAGRRAARRYREHHLLTDDEVLTIADLDPKLKGKAFEALYSTEVANLAGNGNGEATKGQFSLLFQRLLLENQLDVGIGATTNRVKALLRKIVDKVKGV
ncbi:ATP-dependent endonuclease [Qipengyuania sp.]|uniref:ATP-dependent nuclease n=1 Tax=Qipengyuania sp. TaxID=2004515 RepID=UPI0037370F8B